MSHDTLLHRLVRPAVRPLVRTTVTPNQITTVRLAFGLAAGAAFAVGGASATAFGGGAFLFSLLLDRADGELARLGGKISTGGYRYDLTCDCIATVVAFLGLGAGQRAVLGPWSVGLGAVAGVSVVALFLQLNVVKLAETRGLSRQGRTFADPDDAMVLLPPLIWLGMAPQALVVAGVATPLVALALWARSRSARRKSAIHRTA